MDTPLYLTPLIRAGRTNQACELSRVGLLPGGISRESYSGFIALNEEYRTNTFFWFFPAQKNPETAPVILWLEGGIGMSFLISTMAQQGPFKIKEDDGSLEFSDSKFDWTQDHSVIYVDNAIGAGYSFTQNSEHGYSTTSEHAAEGVYEFLMQFFQLFPGYVENPFHIAAFSFGGHFTAPLAAQILRKNEEDSCKLRLNLVGVMMYAPFLDPANQTVDFGTYLYNLGLITEEDKAKYEEEALSIANLVNQGQGLEAGEKVGRLLAYGKTYFTESSGFMTNMSVLDHLFDLDLLASIIALANNKTFRRAIHVGDQSFSLDNSATKLKLLPDTAASVSHYLKEILNKNIPILIIAGQMDIRANHLGIQRMISQIGWNKSSDFKTAQRRQWTVKGELAGYTKSGGGLTYVMMRNAGHFMIREKLEWSLDLFRRTVNGLPL